MQRQLGGPITPAAPQVGFSVDAQTPTTGLGPDGRATPGYDISFTTQNGAKGQVFVPTAMYSVANVRAIIQPHANELDMVLLLDTRKTGS